MEPVILPKRVRRHGIGGALAWLRAQLLAVSGSGAGLVMRMRTQAGVEAGQERVGAGSGERRIVSTIMFVSPRDTGLVQEAEHPPARRVHQLADDGVAEEADLGPLHALAEVLLLLSLEARVNEELLEPLVGVVDEKLLESILLESLKAVNIEYSQHMRLFMGCDLGAERD